MNPTQKKAFIREMLTILLFGVVLMAASELSYRNGFEKGANAFCDGNRLLYSYVNNTREMFCINKFNFNNSISVEVEDEERFFHFI